MREIDEFVKHFESSLTRSFKIHEGLEVVISKLADSSDVDKLLEKMRRIPKMLEVRYGQINDGYDTLGHDGHQVVIKKYRPVLKVEVIPWSLATPTDKAGAYAAMPELFDKSGIALACIDAVLQAVERLEQEAKVRLAVGNSTVHPSRVLHENKGLDLGVWGVDKMIRIPKASK